ncbi:hypothetical protein HMN09_00306000 [Mycena chlorophos]|uniref:Uncharacterized protein n=1 Tax=Mycena chlorophos TaxID=658473 RepID=A0A8H6TIN0_MYCCL|nr:hypothetical protein HMN09_00306000 [Mycena chlorophos]
MCLNPQECAADQVNVPHIQSKVPLSIPEKVNDGSFVASTQRAANFTAKIRQEDLDPSAEIDDACASVRHSLCGKWYKMKEPHNVARFEDHCAVRSQATGPEAERKRKEPAEPAPPAQRLTLYFPPAPAKLFPHPPLSESLRRSFPRKYRCPVWGLPLLPSRSWPNILSGPDLAAVVRKTLQFTRRSCFPIESSPSLAGTRRTWRTRRRALSSAGATISGGAIKATFAAGSNPCTKVIEVPTRAQEKCEPCGPCKLLLKLPEFRKALAIPLPDPANRKFVPHRFQDSQFSELYAKYPGLESLVAEDNQDSLIQRFIQRILRGDFKDDKLLFGIMRVKVLERMRLEEGKTMKNFKHSEDLDAIFGIVHAISPRCYRELKKHIPLRSERSNQQKTSQAPRFPVGITPETYSYATNYCTDYKGKKWFIVGSTGEPLEVANPDLITSVLDEVEKKSELATKLRLWVLQIPLSKIPPLVLALKAIGSKVKGPQLADWHLELMRGLIARGFRIISSASDGAPVERECQRLVFAAGTKIEHRIKFPVSDPQYPDIVVPLSSLNGNVFTDPQDSKHGCKTGGITRPRKNLGLTVYLLVFGDLIDAWQSRNISHIERAKMAIRAHLFLETWKRFLAKAGYPEARHFISKEAYAISKILIRGLLGLQFIHRDHLDRVMALFPWLYSSEPNEHCFATYRIFNADMTFQEAMLFSSKIRTYMQSAILAPDSPVVVQGNCQRLLPHVLRF